MLKIPDKMGLVLEYEYVLDANFAGDTKISNEVNLNSEWSIKKDIVLEEVSSSASATQKIIKIYKVDQDNFKKVLPKTEFKLEYWDKEEKTWKIRIEKVFVGQAGYIQWNLSGADKVLNAATLYKLTETKPVDGYQKTEEAIYIIWQDIHDNFNTSYQTAGAADAGVEQNKIVKFANGGDIHYITNKYTKLAVNKI